MYIRLAVIENFRNGNRRIGTVRTVVWENGGSNPASYPLWMQLLQMVEHQINHKAMLFAYLKLLGVEVNTMHLYGME